MILAGDIGGTKSNLALFRVVNGQLLSEREATYASKAYPHLEEILQDFLTKPSIPEPIQAACFGVAGPIVGETCQLTNLPWIVTVNHLKALLKCPQVYLINDLEAIGYGVPVLPPEQLVSLNPQATPKKGNIALIAAGTGLGEALLYWDGHTLRPCASEGGNTDFAPRNAQQIELLQYMLKDNEHVSYESIVSGPGLCNIYQFLKSSYGTEPLWLTEQMQQQDASAVIANAALTGQSDLCVKALDIFTAIYGAEAGNLALKFMSVQGVYIGGGIAPKILPKLEDGTFMRAFTDKGRYKELMASIPVKIILNPKTGLLGAGQRALSGL